MPLGSAALAGTSLPIDRSYVAKILGFSKISENSIDAVSDRDFVIEVLGNLAILSMHLSRICEDIILWSTSEFGFIEIPDAYSTGSSIMPQKKNPDILELIRAKTGKIYGNLFSLLTVMKGLPLSYNRDLQLDKPLLFDSIDCTKDSLLLLAKIVLNLKVNKEKIKKALEDEGIFATDIAEYLIKKSLTWRRAHNLVGRLFNYSLKKNKKFSQLSLEEFKRFSKIFDRDVFKILDLKRSVDSKTSFGGTSSLNVKRQIKFWSKRLNA
jgi:argininosuccinate lyase